MPNNPPDFAVVGKLLPNELCPGSGMIHLSFHAFCINKLIFILVYQTNGGFQIKLKLIAVLAQIMEQTNQFALILQADFSC